MKNESLFGFSHNQLHKISEKEFNELLRYHEWWLKTEGKHGKRLTLYTHDLTDLHLREEDLSHAVLIDCDFSKSVFTGCKFDSCDLSLSNLTESDFADCDFTGADLRQTNLCSVVFTRCRFIDAKMNWPMVCPSDGSFIGWKIVVIGYSGSRPIIGLAQLEIPADAKRSSATTRKCRCNKAKVLTMTSLIGNDSLVLAAVSLHDPSFVYRVGEVVKVDDFDENRWIECSTGIHFFVTKEEAIAFGKSVY